MSRVLRNALRLSPAVVSAAILLSNPAIARAEQSASGTPDLTPAPVPPTDIRKEIDRQSENNPNNEASNPIVQLTSATEEPLSGTVSEQTPARVEQTTNFFAQIDRYTGFPPDDSAPSAMEQVTSVSQLTDVQPTDWAFQALQSLVERYGCIAGYPDGTFRGNRALTRYEFAAGLNACLERIQELIPESQVSQEDLDKLSQLTEEFGAELSALRGRVDSLEVRTVALEANEFSTTTKLNGEVIWAISDTFNDDNIEDNTPTASGAETSFAQRARLNFDTSFTGKDRLRTRLQAGNFTSLSGGITGTNMTRLGFDTNTNDEIRIGKLFYSFPMGNKLNVIVDAIGPEYNDNVPTFSPIASSATGSISRFGRFNPIYRQGDGGAGITLNFNPSKVLGLSVGYFGGPNAASPTSQNGLFDGPYAALAQLSIKPNDNIGLGLTYVNSYYPGNRVNLTGSTGSGFAQRPFGNVATKSDQFGVEANIRVVPQLTLGGWAGYTQAEALAGARNGDNASLFNWAVTLAAPDLGKKGNLAAILIGQPPKVTDNDFKTREDEDTSFHFEAFYRYAVNGNLSITPGVLVITSPEHNADNETIYLGVLRTTFTF